MDYLEYLLEKLANISEFSFYLLSCLIGAVMLLTSGEFSVMETLFIFPFSGIIIFPVLAMFYLAFFIALTFLAALWLTFSAIFLNHQD